MSIIADRLKAMLERLPHVRTLAAQARRQAHYERHAAFPPGHFHSPIVDVDQVREQAARIWPAGGRPALPGIDLRLEEQVALMADLARYAPDMPFGEEERPGLRYRFTNRWFAHTDGILLHALMRHRPPARVVEVGSGFSSALMLDVDQLFLGARTAFTFIEPRPERLEALLRDGDRERCTLLRKDVQEVPLDVFDDLDRDDILFIDSSHVLKTGSDVEHLLFTVLPRLRPGVRIHVHDVFEGFEYPTEWVLTGHNWNESHALHAFLMYNTAFTVCLFAHHLHVHRPEVYAPWPLAYRNTGGSLWLERC